MTNETRLAKRARDHLGVVPSPEFYDTVRTIERSYRAGLLGGTTHEQFPDVPAHSRERLLYFTLAPALNYQRKSEALWLSALRTYEDPRTRFVYFPENCRHPHAVFRRGLTQYGLAVQPDKQTTIWRTVATTLATRFDADPRNLLASCDFNVPKIVSFVKANKRAFPYLSGPKLLNYWLYMLTCFTTVELSGRSSISIVPDVHVRRASNVLGVVTEEQARSAEAVAQRWQVVLAGTEYSPVDLHAPLWRWSRAGFPSIAQLQSALES